MSGILGTSGVRLLGPVEVLRPDGTRADLQLQCRKVLALLITAGRPVSTGQLVRWIWGDYTPSHAAQMVRSHVRVLRGALRGGILTEAAGYRIAPGECDVDADRFRGLLGQAQQMVSRHAVGAGRTATSALDLWRGSEAMPDVVDVQPLRAEAAYLEELRCQAEELVVLGGLLSGRAELTLPRARMLAELHPQRERFWLQLMVAEALSGRLVEATTSTFWQARRHLVVETGLRSPGLDALQRELLNGVRSTDRLLNLIAQRGRYIA